MRSQKKLSKSLAAQNRGGPTDSTETTQLGSPTGRHLVVPPTVLLPGNFDVLEINASAGGALSFAQGLETNGVGKDPLKWRVEVETSRRDGLEI